MREVGGVGDADRLHDRPAEAGADRRHPLRGLGPVQLQEIGIERPSTMAEGASSASTTSDDAKSLARACADRARPRSRSTWRGLLGEAHEADHIRAGLPMAASSVSGVLRARRS